jgi:hypothetical protein
MVQPHWLAMLCALLMVLATHLALALNWLSPGEGLAPEFRCIPYWDGCMSISRAVRSGPGLLLFRALMLPTAALLAWTWLQTGKWLALLRPTGGARARSIAATGCLGALFLLLYVGWLGSEGAWYGWLRRYGVVFYFGLTALAQLLLVHALWPIRRVAAARPLGGPLHALFALVCLQWLAGVLSVAKRLLLTDAALIDRIENIIEWWFALALATSFLAVGELLRRSGYRLGPRLGPGQNH